MYQQHRPRHGEPAWSRGSSAAVGIVLIGLGVVLLAVNTFDIAVPFDFDIGRIGWPALILVPGLILLVVGLLTGGDGGQGLAVSGGIITTIGALLAYQSATQHWTSWAYAWALVAPTSVGVSLTMWGALHGRRDVAGQGVTTAGIGLVLFIVGFAFFEAVLHIGDSLGLVPLGLKYLPIGLIVAGVLVIFGRLFTESRKPQQPPGQWRPSYPAPIPDQQPMYPPAYPTGPQSAFPPPAYQPAPPAYQPAPLAPPPAYTPTPLPAELDPRVKPEPNPWQLPDASAPASPPADAPGAVASPRVSSDEETTETRF